ncbi:methyltransferase domain-containing protein [Desulfofundulus thermobenzoicus]|uniref:Methyltransferase domain-containing protein n=1 Tax=Desulfofundulus thermobenzoicus TaxID=29376 RepID=A0A6N7IW71_9FIRM|nr:methyltransferase domain-containing protein [Desulfofundulus thermobenzoicus]MQL53843.1 methyltransferase domain-containing protein [Desulfofundulus thermobenzoicus]
MKPQLNTRELTIYLPGLTLAVKVAASMEELITDPADEDNIPLWADIWPAARGMARHIWECLDFSGQSVLELGAGAGLPGVVCGLKGARVTFSDYKPGALELAAMNARSSGVKDFSCFLADWRDFRLDRRFDWIIGSDILYDPKFHPYLSRIFEQNLKPGGQLLIAHPGRPATFNFIEEWHKKTGRPVTEKIIPVTIEDPYFPYYHVHIHQF